MCGVAGIVRFDGRRVLESEVRAMTAVLEHRGPDDEGVDVRGNVGFGHTRLSIIDLAGSPQPMQTADGRHLLSYNGEVFNYRELRRASPHPFRTNGDTEVVLRTLAEHGPKGAERFVGQFACALHDRGSGRTWLIRDRLGVLPLYYWVDGSQLVFASEPKALLAVLGDRVGVDHDQLRSYLKARAVHAPATLFSGVRKVPPGHYVEVSATGEVRVEAYWSLPEAEDVLDCTPDEAVDLVEDTLRTAVDSALVADVPVGSYLSGGVDSSLVVGFADAARRRGGATTPLMTFSAEFGDPRFDEGHHALRVSEFFGTDHHRVLVRPHDFGSTWEELTWHRDAPVSEPADIAVAQLALEARRHVKVVLSGEGSDELFGGYPKYRWVEASSRLGRLPAPVRRHGAGFVERALPARLGKARIGIRALTGSPRSRLEDWFAPFTDREVDALLGVGPPRAGREVRARDAIDRMARLDLDTWLPDNLLERGDRMSMASSLELRPPFLDHRLVELAFRLPSAVKVRDGQTKWVLKQVAARHLPADIVHRPKAGFRVPLDDWFRGDLEAMARDLLTGGNSFVASVMDGGVVSRMLLDHARGRRDEEIRIWTLLSLEMWGRRFFGSSAVVPSQHA